MIRPTVVHLQSQHLGRLNALFKVCAPGMLGRTYNPETTLIALHDSKVIGVVMVWGVRMPYGWIDCLFVLPEYQRHGVGVWLFEAAEQLLREHGVVAIRVCAIGDAKEMLTRAGYREGPACTIMERDYA